MVAFKMNIIENCGFNGTFPMIPQDNRMFHGIYCILKFNGKLLCGSENEVIYLREK